MKRVQHYVSLLLLLFVMGAITNSNAQSVQEIYAQKMEHYNKSNEQQPAVVRTPVTTPATKEQVVSPGQTTAASSTQGTNATPSKAGTNDATLTQTPSAPNAVANTNHYAEKKEMMTMMKNATTKAPNAVANNPMKMNTSSQLAGANSAANAGNSQALQTFINLKAEYQNLSVAAKAGDMSAKMKLPVVLQAIQNLKNSLK